MKCKTLLPLLFVVPLAFCDAGTVQLWSGETLKGKISWDVKTGLVISPEAAAAGGPSGAPSKIDLAKVRDAVFITPDPAAAPVQQSQPVGAILVNGSFIAGQPHDIQEATIKVDFRPVPAASIAWIILNPIPLENLPKIPSGHTGAILPGGEFFEGAFEGIHEYKIGINSPLLGPQRFSTDKILAVIMRDRQTSHALYVVTASNGSTYQTDDLKFDQQGLNFQDALLGPIKIKFWDIKEIASGNGRFQILTDVSPVEAPGSAKSLEDFKIQPAVDPGSPAVLLTRANVPVVYTVPEGLTVFTASVSLPKDAPASAHFTFSVYGDGRFLIQRSLPMGAGDPPQLLRAELNRVHVISLRAEPSFSGSEKVFGQWESPMLFHP